MHGIASMAGIPSTSEDEAFVLSFPTTMRVRTEQKHMTWVMFIVEAAEDGKRAETC